MVVMPDLSRPPHAFAPAGRRPPIAPLELADEVVSATRAGRLHPAARALLDLYVANRREGERVGQCFARLGAPTYTAILHEALLERVPDVLDGDAAAERATA